MSPHLRASRTLDLLAGLVAILAVLALSISVHAIGQDLRLLWSLTGTAFFFAGVARARSVVHNIWLHGLLVSCPGLLGTAALIMNDGFHRLLIPVTLAITAILLTVAGIETRLLWSRSRPKAWLAAFAFFAALTIVSVAAIPLLSAKASVKLMDRSAPSFVVSRLDGTPLRSSDIRGRIVVLAFWATWCLPCQSELPEIESVYKKYERTSDVIFLAVDANWDGETAAKAKDFLQRKKLDLPAAFDDGGVARQLRVDGLPTIVLIDRDGNIRMTHYGYDASEHLPTVLSNHIDRLLSR